MLAVLAQSWLLLTAVMLGLLVAVICGQWLARSAVRAWAALARGRTAGFAGPDGLGQMRT